LFSFYRRAMREISPDELELAVKFVIERNRGLCPGKWPKGPDGSALARRIVEHFALARWRVVAPPPAPLHSTPAGAPGTDP
jgi:hypothetical protein